MGYNVYRHIMGKNKMRLSRNAVALCEISLVLCLTNYITGIQRAGIEAHRDRMRFFWLFRPPRADFAA